MNKIFVGLIFFLVKLNLNLFGIPIVIFPDFVAFIFIYFGILELSRTTPVFSKALKPASFLIFYNLITSILYMIPSMLSNYRFITLFQLVSELMLVYIFYIVIVGLKEYQSKVSMPIETSALEKRWRLIAIFAVASPLFSSHYYDPSLFSRLITDNIDEFTYMALCIVIASFVFSVIEWFVLVYFAAELNRVRATYNTSRLAR